MEAIIAAIIGGIFAVIAARIGKRQSRDEEQQEVVTSNLGKILCFLITLSPVIVSTASYIVACEAKAVSIVTQGLITDFLPSMSSAMLVLMVVALLGLLRITSGIFNLLLGRVFAPKALFRAGLFGLILVLLMQGVLRKLPIDDNIVQIVKTLPHCQQSSDGSGN